MKTRIIGFCGKKGSGKNFVAGLLARMAKEQGKTVECHAYADPFKKFCHEILGISEGLLWGDDNAKNIATEYKWINMPARMFVGPIAVRRLSAIKSGQEFLTVRDVLQIVGTELGRDVWGVDVWVKSMERLMLKSTADYFLVTDVRFPNEVDVLHRNGGKLWLVKGRGVVSGDAHATENSIDGCTPDLIIDNSPGVSPEFLGATIKEAARAFYGAL